MLKAIKPEQKSNPLGYETRRFVKKIKAAAPRLEDEGKYITVVVSTQGVPTNITGDDGSTTIMKECIKNWKELSELPVKLVFRLCTNDQKVVNFYKRVSVELQCVVLGNYWVEVRYDLHLPKMS